MIDVLIAADPTLFRDGLELMIGLNPEFELVGLADTADSLPMYFEKRNVDVILLGFEHDECDQKNIINSIRAVSQSKIILLVTSLTDYAKNSILREVDGYVPKNRKCSLESVIKTVASGMSIIPQEMYNHLVKEADNSRTISSICSFTALTKAEQEIVRLVAQGKSNKKIAATIYNSEGTVRNRLTTIFKKLGVRDRVQLAVTAVQAGYVEAAGHNVRQAEPR